MSATPSATALDRLLVLAGQARASGRARAAAVLCERAVATWPDASRAWWALARQKLEIRRLSAAAIALQAVCVREPDDAEAHSLLAEVLLALDRPRAAVGAARRAVALDAGAVARVRLGRALARCGDVDGARQELEHLGFNAVVSAEVALAAGDVAGARRALGGETGSSDGVLAGRIALAAGAPAVAILTRALARGSHIEEPGPWLARAHLAGGEVPAALGAALAAAERDPDSPAVLEALGEVRLTSGDAAGAIEALQRALVQTEATVRVRGLLVRALSSAGRFDEAATLAGDPALLTRDPGGVAFVQGLARLERGELVAAEVQLRRAVLEGTEHARAHLGAVLLRLGRVDEALAAARVGKETPALRAVRLTAMQCSEQVVGARLRAAAERPRPVRVGRRGRPSPATIALLTARPNAPLYAAMLRVVPEALRARGFDVRVLVDGPGQGDVEVVGALSDAALAARLGDLRVDALIDLDGHHGGGRRAGLLARRAAPLQGAWLGFVDPPGDPGVDFIITDSVVAPEALASTARLALPGGLVCVGPPPEPAPLTPPPALLVGHVTIGIIGHPARLGPTLKRTAARLLTARPAAHLRLVLEEGGADELAALRAVLEDAGTPGDRLELAVATTWPERMAQLSGIDLVLDGFPCSGPGAGLEALWMGVPVLTLPSDRAAGRLMASVLRRIGRPEWVANDAQRWLDEALVLHDGPEHRLEARRGLRGALGGSPVHDGARLAAELHAGLDALWAELPDA